MTHSAELEEIIRKEFSCYYMADELPGWNQLEQELPEMARRSAVRLKHGLGNNEAQELIKLLEISSQDPNHSVIQTICDATLIDWAEEPQDWSVLQKLLHLIVMNLKQLSVA